MNYSKKKKTVINGCEASGPLETAVSRAIRSKLGVAKAEFYWIDLKEKKLQFCRACDVCQVKDPGTCAFHDGLNEILEQYLVSRMVIIITPVLFGCFNSLTKNFIDRTEPLFLPYQVLHNGKTIMKKRYERYPDVLCIGISEQHNANCKSAFLDFISNCNLCLASENFETQVISDRSDVDKLSTCLKRA